MQNEKIENLLNLALDATEREREKSLELDVGYDRAARTWEVIVRSGGDAERLQTLFAERFPGQAGEILVTNLRNGYAILRLPESLVEQVAALPEIEYMEKPKRLFFAVDRGIRASCITQLQSTSGGAGTEGTLSGSDVLIGIIDSGVDYSHPDFRNADGTTRILALWDQTIAAGSVPDVRGGETEAVLGAPEGYRLGTEFSGEILDLALAQPTERERYEVCPSRDLSGHGTHVAGIAAGNGRASAGRYRGVAYQSGLVVVKLGNPQEGGFPRTTELMQAVDYCLGVAERAGKPIALNLSFGNSYGSHSGTSLIETFLNDMSSRQRSAIVVGSGNEGAAAGHTSGRLDSGQTADIPFAVSPYETAFGLQIWKSYVDEMAVSVVHPDGTVAGPILPIQGPQRFSMGRTEILLYYGEPSPYSPYQEIYLDFLPVREYLDNGTWNIRLTAQTVVTGAFDLWLPSGGVLNSGTGFLFPVEETTLTIPSTAAKVITVGAYDARTNQPAAFSGRGYTRETDQVKPDLVAPGVDIVSCAPGGGYTSRTGTSMATPFVTGGAALLMEWGIVRGNDRYLYGEKLKAYLLRGANRTRIPARGGAEGTGYPDPQLGYGTLCVAASIPK